MSVVLGGLAGCNSKGSDGQSSDWQPPLESPGGQTEAAAFTTDGAKIKDACGNDFVMRGVNYPFTWYYSRNTGNDFAAIKAKGANTVRVVMSNGTFSGETNRWHVATDSELTGIIDACRDNELVCVLEVQDTVGYGEKTGSTSLAEAVTYWKGIQDQLAGTESFIIINIGNESRGNTGCESSSGCTAWVNDTVDAIEAMRATTNNVEGFSHTLMVDAPNWGQDWTNTMQSNAATVLAADSQDNTILSVHMYEVYDSQSVVENYIHYFVDHDLPLVVGEFGWKHTCDGINDVLEGEIMAEAAAHGVGYIAWSWSGNSDESTDCDLSFLDLTNDFSANSLTDWGTILFETDPNGIKTSTPAADPHLFDGTCDGSGDMSSPSKPGNFRWTDKTQTTISLAWNASTDNVGVTGYRIYPSMSDYMMWPTRIEPVVTGSSARSLTLTSLVPDYPYDICLQALDAAGNASGCVFVSNPDVEGGIVKPDPDDDPPTAPTNFQVEAVSATKSFIFTWTASTDTVGVYNYDVEFDYSEPYDFNPDSGHTIMYCDSAACSVTYDGHYSPDKHYHIRISATDRSQNSSPWTVAEVDTP